MVRWQLYRNRDDDIWSNEWFKTTPAHQIPQRSAVTRTSGMDPKDSSSRQLAGATSCIRLFGVQRLAWQTSNLRVSVRIRQETPNTTAAAHHYSLASRRTSITDDCCRLSLWCVNRTDSWPRGFKDNKPDVLKLYLRDVLLGWWTSKTSATFQTSLRSRSERAWISFDAFETPARDRLRTWVQIPAGPPNMKCKYCDKDKPEDDFSIARRINGKIYRRLKCSECKVKRQKQRRHEIAAWLSTFKAERGCVLCGIKDPRVLQFDHLGKKEFNIAEVVSRGMGKSRILQEIIKCQVLCANCHAIKTFEDGR